MTDDLRKKFSVETRKRIADRLLEQHPDRIPVIVLRGTSRDPEIDRKKFLVPSDLPVYRFINELRHHINIKPHQALFIFFGGRTLAHSNTMSDMYSRHKDPDGFLYVTYSIENTFG